MTENSSTGDGVQVGMGERPTCSTCDAPATCFGTYEGITGYGCDTCCGHGCEDGHCEMLNEGEDDSPAPTSPAPHEGGDGPEVRMAANGTSYVEAHDLVRSSAFQRALVKSAGMKAAAPPEGGERVERWLVQHERDATEWTVRSEEEAERYANHPDGGYRVTHLSSAPAAAPVEAGEPDALLRMKDALYVAWKRHGVEPIEVPSVEWAELLDVLAAAALAAQAPASPEALDARQENALTFHRAVAEYLKTHHVEVYEEASAAVVDEMMGLAPPTSEYGRTLAAIGREEYEAVHGAPSGAASPVRGERERLREDLVQMGLEREDVDADDGLALITTHAQLRGPVKIGAVTVTGAGEHGDIGIWYGEPHGHSIAAGTTFTDILEALALAALRAPVRGEREELAAFDRAAASLALNAVAEVATRALAYWDEGRHAKVGKILSALAGNLPGYMVDTDLIHNTAAALRASVRGEGDERATERVPVVPQQGIEPFRRVGSVECVECPACLFTFDARHINEPEGETYSCDCGYTGPRPAPVRVPDEGEKTEVEE